MIKEAVATGATIEEAKQAAFLLLGAAEDADVNFEIIDLPVKKTLGLFGGSPARVRAFLEVADSEKKPEKKAKEEGAAARREKRPQKRMERRGTGKAAEATAAGESVKTQKNGGKNAREQKPAELERPLPPAAAEKAEIAKKYLADVLLAMGVENAAITLRGIDGGVEYDIETPGGQGMGAVIGRKGETLDALQHLCSLVFNRGEGRTGRVTLNPGDYREKRAKTLEDTARRIAGQAVENQRTYALDPMNSYERRIVHTVVQGIEGVASWSIGEGDSRRVCIGVNKGEAPPFERGRRERGRGDRSRRSRGKERGGLRERREPYIPQGQPRDPRSDAADIPLFGRIEK